MNVLYNGVLQIDHADTVLFLLFSVFQLDPVPDFRGDAPINITVDSSTQPADQTQTVAKSATQTPMTAQTPSAALKTPTAALKTPNAALKTPTAALKTPNAALKTPTAALKTPTAALKTPTATQTQVGRW